MYARLVRYEAGQPDNAEEFVDEVMHGFDARQQDLPSAVLGSFLFTRRDDGEAIEVTIWENAEDAHAAATQLDAAEVPATGAREVVVGRRDETQATAVATTEATELWEVWQGRQNWKQG